MGIILEDIIAHSHTGFAVKCGDGVQRSLYPCVPIKSADYEEEYGFLLCLLFSLANSLFSCVMTLTRGTNSYYPCPICLVPEDKLAIHDKAYPPRTQATMKKVYNDAMEMRTVEEPNNLVKNYGLQGIDVSDPFFLKY